MRKVTALIIVLCLALCSLSSCTLESYDDGYEDGYDYGYEEGVDEGYYFGYDDGYIDGSKDGWIDYLKEPGMYLEDAAVHYARKHSGWHPEEAWAIIESYQNSENGSPPSHQDYLDAIDSLIYFYEYFYGRHYE